jgi:nitrite reductase (NADH) small subunit
MSWIRVTETANIPLREGRAIEIGDREIAIFNLGGGRFVASDNACPHRGGPLADGIVSGTHVVCPLHAYKICLETGNVAKPDVCVRVDTYEVRVENGVVLVEIDAAEEKAA